MCGIFGLITTKKDIPVAKLIREGLERLEYRGYDSAGIAIVNDSKIEVRKREGRIADINADGWFDIWSRSYKMGNSRSSYC